MTLFTFLESSDLSLKYLTRINIFGLGIEPGSSDMHQLLAITSLTHALTLSHIKMILLIIENK